MSRAVQDGDPAAVLAAEEAQQERRHALLIGTSGAALKPVREFAALHDDVPYTPGTA